MSGCTAAITASVEVLRKFKSIPSSSFIEVCSFASTKKCVLPVMLNLQECQFSKILVLSVKQGNSVTAVPETSLMAEQTII